MLQLYHVCLLQCVEVQKTDKDAILTPKPKFGSRVQIEIESWTSICQQFSTSRVNVTAILQKWVPYSQRYLILGLVGTFGPRDTAFLHSVTNETLLRRTID